MIDKALLLEPVIEETIRLNHILNQTVEDFTNTHPDSNDSLKIISDMFMDEDCSKAREDVTNYLEQLTQEEVALIQAVMYVGRDNKSSLSNKYRTEEEIKKYHSDEDPGENLSPEELLEYYYNSTKNDLKENAIQHMLGKGQLSKYLKDGIAILKLN